MERICCGIHPLLQNCLCSEGVSTLVKLLESIEVIIPEKFGKFPEKLPAPVLKCFWPRCLRKYVILFVWLYGYRVVFLRSQRKPEIMMLRDGICPVLGLFRLKKASTQHR